MEGSRKDDLRKQLKEREVENRELRERLAEADAELDRLREENAQLRKELRAAGLKPKGKAKERKRKGKPKVRKPRQGCGYRSGPAESAANGPTVEVPVTMTTCPCCGGPLKYERTDEATVTDMPEQPRPEVKSYAVEVHRCERCGQPFRGQHPDVEPDQYGATAHRVGRRVKAAAHAMHYGMGVPVRKLPWMLRELTGIDISQSALTQDALKKASGSRVVGNAYQELRAAVPTAPVVYTDDTGWPIHGKPAYLMGFDTDQVTVFQIRNQHRNEEVRELIPSDYAGVMVTDRGPSYEAEELLGVKQQKCLDHLNRNIDEVLETKTGAARGFGLKLKSKLKEARQLWRDQRAGKAEDFAARAQQIDQELTDHLRIRRLTDKDNQRLLDGIGLQHDRGNLVRFLKDPNIEPTNNRGERTMRPPAISRRLSYGSKNERGAEAFAAFSSVIQTAVKKRVSSTIDALHDLFRSKPRDGPLDPNRSPI